MHYLIQCLSNGRANWRGIYKPRMKLLLGLADVILVFQSAQNKNNASPYCMQAKCVEDKKNRMKTRNFGEKNVENI